LPLLTQTFRHPGNHRYAFPLHKAVQVLGTPQPYPKFTETVRGAVVGE
jgi:hypothetical protein